MKTLLLCVSLSILFCACESKDPSNLRYWSNVMNSDPTNEKLNSFTFEEKYKIIEFSYNEIGFYSNYPYEQISNQIENNQAFMSDEFLYKKHQINKLAYYVFAFWGSNLNIPGNTSEKFNYVKLSDQIWSFEGEQGDLDYGSYIQMLDKMLNRPSPFSNWEETYGSDSKTYRIVFEYQDLQIKWDIENEIGGEINNKVFELFTDLCQSEYINNGNYYLIMESGGGIAMYLTYSSEEYLRTLWNFPKINKRGSFRTLAEYGKL